MIELTHDDQVAASEFALTRAKKHTKAWHDAREGYLQALRDERSKPLPSNPEGMARAGASAVSGQVIGGPMNLIQPTETWGAP